MGPAGLNDLPSPCYVVDTSALAANLRVLEQVQRASGATILLALKGFAMWNLFPLIARHLCGVTASSLHEARLGREAFGGQVHVYAPAYRDDEFDQLIGLCDHVIFNSFAQWRRFRARAAGVQCGMRINPRHSEVGTALYDPCAPGSRLGVTAPATAGEDMDGLSGLHFHTLCELGPDALQRTLAVVERDFDRCLAGLQWVNMGGGHHITAADYDIDALVSLIIAFRQRHDLAVFLEPGAAVVLGCGVLVATVLDIVHNDVDIAILDTSASAHMPDVLEMPYRPAVRGAAEPGAKAHTYRLGGLTCLAGDVIGDYAFDRPLAIGDRIVFEDMAHYTMVKNNTFNGVNLPAIATHDPGTDRTEVVRQFGYEDYRGRLS